MMRSELHVLCLLQGVRVLMLVALVVVSGAIRAN